MIIGYQYIPIIPEVFNNHTLQAIQSPEEFRGHLLNVTNNLMLCKDICQGVPDACQDYYQIQFSSSSVITVRFWFFIIVYGIFACNVVSGLFGIKIKKLTYPEVIENQEKLKKKIQGLANGCEDGEGEDVLDTWYMQIEITMQSFLDGPAGPPPDNNRLAQLLTNQENKLERKRKRLFRILEVDSQQLTKKLKSLKQKSYFLKRILNMHRLESTIEGRISVIDDLIANKDKSPLEVFFERIEVLHTSDNATLKMQDSQDLFQTEVGDAEALKLTSDNTETSITTQDRQDLSQIHLVLQTIPLLRPQ